MQSTLATIWHNMQANACGLARRNYVSRAAGFIFLSVLAIETYYLYRQETLLLIAAIVLLFWPHLAFYSASRSQKTSKQREYINIYLDSFFAGCLIALFDFSVIEMQAIFFALCANNMSLGGVLLFLRGLVVILFGIGSVLLITGVQFILFAGAPMAITAALFAFLYITVTNYVYYKQAKSLIRVKQELESVNAEIASQRDMLNEQAVEIEIANSTLQETNLLLEKEREELEQANQMLDVQKDRTDALILNILPQAIAERLKSGETIIADSHSEVSILFADIVGFTTLSARITPEELVQTLDMIFRLLDSLAEYHGVEKIKTIGDCYMAVAGAPIRTENHAIQIAQFACEVQSFIQAIATQDGTPVQMRIGIHTGKVVAGVIGKRKAAYDLWGDAVNTASRMESHGEPGHIHVSEDFATILQAQIASMQTANSFVLSPRGTVNIKGKGTMQTYFLVHTHRDAE